MAGWLAGWLAGAWRLAPGRTAIEAGGLQLVPGALRLEAVGTGITAGGWSGPVSLLAPGGWGGSGWRDYYRVAPSRTAIGRRLAAGGNPIGWPLTGPLSRVEAGGWLVAGRWQLAAGGTSIEWRLAAGGTPIRWLLAGSFLQ
jgi:hypothetical protein